MAEPGDLRVRGRGAALREEPKTYLSNSQRTNTTHSLSFPSLRKLEDLYSDNRRRALPVQEVNVGSSCYPIADVPSIDDLEESLRKLKVEVDNLASTLSYPPGQERTFDLEPGVDSSPFSSRWPVAPGGSYEELGIGGPPMPPTEAEWFLKPKHLLRPMRGYSALTHLGLPTFTTSPVSRMTGLLGSEIAAWNPLPSADLAFPLKIGSPHVIGVKSLLPPKIPVRARLSGRVPSPPEQGRSLSLGRTRDARSRSSSPAAKRTRSWSQSPRPVWRPSSAKADACAQPPPQFGMAGGVRKNGRSNRQPRSRICRPGTFASRSWTSTKTTGKGTPSDSWSPYSLPSSSISSPTAQEINERFLQILAEGAVGKSLVERSPYQQELARLRLERLRVEEAWLLELKRQQELERTRGPDPKWYEMRNSRFHYEARKNNELLRNSQEVESVYNYRQELATASKVFQQQPSSSYLETQG